MNIVSLWLGKVGTVLADRRAWVYVAAVVLSLLAIPYNVTGVDNEAVGAIVMVVRGTIILAGALGLTKSWENRPPSGLKYKEMLQAFLEGDSEEMQALKQFLEDAGIYLGNK